MSRTMVNFLLDTTLGLTFVLLIWCATVLQFVFPPGTMANGWRLWGWSYDQWHLMQFSLVGLLALGILVHVMLHWTWVCGVLATRFSRAGKGKVDDGIRTLYGVGLLIALFNAVGLGVAAAVLTIQGPS